MRQPFHCLPMLRQRGLHRRFHAPLLLMLAVGVVHAADSTHANPSASKAASAPAPSADTKAPASTTYFQPPPESSIPSNAFGDLVRRGQDLFMNTKALLPNYVGNDLNCVNCHLDRGRKPNSAPLWAAYNMYPAYRKKNNKVNTFVERMQGCFEFSMNGKVPAADSEILTALTTYAYWLSTNAPIGKPLEGRGFSEPPPPKGGYDIARGKLVYENNVHYAMAPTAKGRKWGAQRCFRHCGEKLL